MEQVVALAAVTFLAGKIIELVKYLRTKDWNGAITLLSVHGAGAIVMLLAAESEVFETIILPGTSAAIGTLDTMSVVLLGLVTTSLTSTAYDFKKAFDNTDSAKQPSLTGTAPGKE